MDEPLRGAGIASVGAGGLLAALGAVDVVYTFLLRSSPPPCPGGGICYVTIVEPSPWSYLAILSGLGLVVLGILLLARDRSRRRAD